MLFTLQKSGNKILLIRYNDCVNCWLSNNYHENLKYSKPEADILHYLHKLFQIYFYFAYLSTIRSFQYIQILKDFDLHYMFQIVLVVIMAIFYIDNVCIKSS